MKHIKKIVVIVATLTSTVYASQSLPSDKEIKALVQQELDKSGTLNPADSPLHASIVRIVNTYNELWPLREKEWEKHAKAMEEYDKQLDMLAPDVEAPEAPNPMNITIGWCDCIKPIERIPFILQVVRETLQKYPDLNKKLVYASLGSGELLQDLLLIQELVYAGYTDIVVNTIEHEYKDKQLSTLSQFRKKLIALQVARIKAGYPVKITVSPYISVATYAQTKPKSEKIDVITLVDVGITFSGEQAWSKYINQIEVRVSPIEESSGESNLDTDIQTEDEISDEDAPAVNKGIPVDWENYIVIMPHDSPNYGYVKYNLPEGQMPHSALRNAITMIINENIKSAERIRKILKPLENGTGDNDTNNDLEITYGSNVMYDMKRLLSFAHEKALVFYFDQLRTGPRTETQIILRTLTPRLFNPDAMIKQELADDGFVPVTSSATRE